jgi:signal transduction histidine kinase/anti-sigma regulatory factor (Ser/Thr protein kinase)
MELSREELIKQREDLDRKLDLLDKDKIRFSIDAGLMDRLGRELVGKQETAVSELVKNAYDADANEVTLTFINSDVEGGTLIIDDDGHGMDMDSLRNGFMRISSTDKIHTPVSPKFNRKRAGRKGIGRFATHRLGRKLTITTQTKDEQRALKLTINWDDYAIDRELQLITNNLEEVPKTKVEGTTLTIDILREGWSLSEIKRVFRYVTELLQPSYLSDRLKKSSIVFGSQKDASFSVQCKKVTNGLEATVSDIGNSFFDKSLAIFEGFVDDHGEGFCFIESKSLGLNQSDNELIIERTIANYPERSFPDLWVDGQLHKNYLYLNKAQVHFKAYYFIYQRVDYYEGDGIGISATDLKQVQDFGKKEGGIRLYRNGFRVSPYGEMGDDWLEIDERYTASGGKDVIPFSNKNVFGFVEIVDENGDLFEETSSREGILKNEVFRDLVDFLRDAFQACRRRLESTVEFKEKRSKRQKRLIAEKTQKERLHQLKLFIDEKTTQNKTGEDDGSENNRFDAEELKATVEEVERTIEEQLDEIALLRVLAGMGLSIGEFVHEFRQYSPAFDGDLVTLAQKSLNEETKKIVHNLRANFDLFKIYASYFDETVQENAQRRLRIINIREPIRSFLKNVEHSNVGQQGVIQIEHLFDGYDLYTLPMHPSEWASILINLYSNSKKAIDKAGVEGRILIAAKEESKRIVVEFSDNGIGIPEENKERIFHAFFTTSIPANRRTPQEKEFTGSGLGLKIVSDIIESYDGEVYVAPPPIGFKTCIRLEVPKATDAQIEEQYG